MKTFRTLIFASLLASSWAFAQSADMTPSVDIKCPAGTELRDSEGLGLVFYCVKPGERRLDTTPYLMLHKNGKVYAKGQFVDGKREGLWEYFDEAGRLKASTHFKNDHFDGERAFYDEAGKIQEMQHWQAGKREGEWGKQEQGKWNVRKFKADRLVVEEKAD
jgi:hypothetical protein